MVLFNLVILSGILFSSRPHAEKCLRVREIGEEVVGFVRGQFLDRVPAGRDRDGLRADGASALHVERRIADHPHVAGVEVAAEVRPHFRDRHSGHVVALVVIVAEAAAGKEVPQPEVAELVLRAGSHVAGEEPEHDARSRPEIVQQQFDAGADLPAVRPQRARQVREIGVVQADLIRGARVDAMSAEQIAADGPVGAAGVFDGVANLGNAELLLESRFHRGLPRPAGADERAVDVEEKDWHKKTNHRDTEKTDNR